MMRNLSKFSIFKLIINIINDNKIKEYLNTLKMKKVMLSSQPNVFIDALFKNQLLKVINVNLILLILLLIIIKIESLVIRRILICNGRMN